MKVWLTNEVLFTGAIVEAEGNLCTGRTDLIQINHRDMQSRMILKPNWHDTKEGAILDAQRKLDYAIKSKKRDIEYAQEKLNHLIEFRKNFNPPGV